MWFLIKLFIERVSRLSYKTSVLNLTNFLGCHQHDKKYLSGHQDRRDCASVSQFIAKPCLVNILENYAVNICVCMYVCFVLLLANGQLAQFENIYRSSRVLMSLRV